MTALSGDKLNVSLAPQSVTTFIIDGMKGSATLENKIDITSSMLSGSDSWKSDSNTTFHKAFDGNTSTFFDGVGDGYTQVDLGQVYDISAVGYCPRSGYEHRLTDGMFLFSEDGTNWTTAYTIQNKPSFGMHYVKKLSGSGKARYIKYTVPSGAPKNEYNNDNVYCCNIAEIELYGTPLSAQKIAGDVNGDGELNIADLVALRNFLLKNTPLPNGEAADLCADSKINVFDMIALKRLIINK